MTSTQKPDLEHILDGYSIFDRELEQRKWEILEYARDQRPIIKTSGDGGYWIVTRYDDVRRVLQDPETFSSSVIVPSDAPFRMCPLDSDPPVHGDIRQLLNPLFSRSHLKRFEPAIRAKAAEIVEGWLDKGAIEFMSEFASPFVGAALAQVVFDDIDEQKITRAREVVTAAAVENSHAAMFELACLAGEYLSEREDNPGEQQDVLNAIMTGTVESGRPLSDDERLGVITVLFVGGLDTTRGALGSIAYHLAGHPDIETRMRDPRWARQDMDEFIRLESPVGVLGRIATRDTQIDDVPIAKGERVWVRYDSANRDESRFPLADQLVFDPPRPGHAGFGLGIHRCLGVHLARIQIRIAFDELLRRVTNIRLQSDVQLEWAPGNANGLEALPITFDRR